MSATVDRRGARPPYRSIGTSLAYGFLAEHGPNSFVSSASVEALIEQLGLDDEVFGARRAKLRVL